MIYHISTPDPARPLSLEWEVLYSLRAAVERAGCVATEDKAARALYVMYRSHTVAEVRYYFGTLTGTLSLHSGDAGGSEFQRAELRSVSDAEEFCTYLYYFAESWVERAHAQEDRQATIEALRDLRLACASSESHEWEFLLREHIPAVCTRLIGEIDPAHNPAVGSR